MKNKEILTPIIAISLAMTLSAKDQILNPKNTILDVNGDQTISQSYDTINIASDSKLIFKGYIGINHLNISNNVNQVIFATESGETTFNEGIINERITIQSIGTSTNKITLCGENYAFKNIEIPIQNNGNFTITSKAKLVSFLDKITVEEKQNLSFSFYPNTTISPNRDQHTLILKNGYENQGSLSAYFSFYSKDIIIQTGGNGIVTSSGKTTFQIGEANNSIKFQNLDGSLGTIKTLGGESYFHISVAPGKRTTKEIQANIIADGENAKNTLRIWSTTDAILTGNLIQTNKGNNDVIIDNASTFALQGETNQINKLTMSGTGSIIFDSKNTKINASITTIESNNNLALNLKGDINPITLTLGGWQDKNFKSIVTSGQNNVINIASTNGAYKTLKIGNPNQSDGIEGNGLNFVISAESNVGKNQTQYADKIIIHSANNLENGANKETLHYIGVLFRDDENVEYEEKGNNNILIASVANDSKVEFQKEQTSIYGFEVAKVSYVTAPTDENGNYQENGNYTSYFIGSKQNLGILQAEQEITATAFTLNYDLYMANFNSLNKRMGELRENPHSQSVWARVFNGALSNDFGLGSKSNYTTIQAGYDYAFGFEGANNYLGVALSYALSTSTSNNAYDINGEKRSIDGIYSNAFEIAIYNAYVSDTGWYNDSIAKFSYLLSNFDIKNLNNGESTSNDTKNFALTLSDEVGYRFALGEVKEWSITPQLELGFGYFNQSDFKQTLQNSGAYLDSNADAVLTLRTRVGSSFGYNFKNFTQGNSFNASVYVGAFYEYDYVSGGEIHMGTQRGTQANQYSNLTSDGRMIINVGTNMSVEDHTRIYFDFEKSFMGKINTDYQVNFGVRYSFGESNGYTPQNIETQEESKTPLKIEEKEKIEENKERENQKSISSKENKKQSEEKTSNETRELDIKKQEGK